MTTNTTLIGNCWKSTTKKIKNWSMNPDTDPTETVNQTSSIISSHKSRKKIIIYKFDYY